MDELTAWAYQVMIYPWNEKDQLITILLFGKKPEGQERPTIGAIHFHADGAVLKDAAYETGDQGQQVHTYHMPISMYHAVLTTLREEGPFLILRQKEDGSAPLCLSTDEEPIGESERK
jgi:hypothetical protein